jgi:alpha-L-fucosidase 2
MFARGIFAAVLLLGVSTAVLAAVPPDALDASNVVWSSPSTNSAGSMPLGNGDLGLNVWVEQTGDLLLLLSKTDAWDEHGRLLKLGRVRVKVTPNPFQSGQTFRQELRLRHGEIVITGGSSNACVKIAVWVDANDPVIHIEGTAEEPIALRADLELWRTHERALVGGEESGCDSFGPDLAPVVYPDAILGEQVNRVAWFHRNRTSIWPVTLKHQGLESWLGEGRDPLLKRTFGGLMRGPGLVSAGVAGLASAKPSRKVNLDIFALAAQTDSFDEWLFRMERAMAVAAELGPIDARNAHQAWWNAFWNRSWIRITPAAGGPEDRSSERVREAQVVTQGYALQRFVSACAGRGGSPIKFNGSIFSVDLPGKFDPDYRQWGGCYWFQNTRLVYWPMLASGDFEMMQPFFKMFADAVPLAKACTRLYFGHGGAFFPETMHFWGAYHNGDMGYGWEREGEPLWRTRNKYIRYYWSGGLELAAMLLDYYAWTRDERFFREAALPLVKAVLAFYSEHYPRGADGKWVIAPAQALETWWDCRDPMPEVAGLQFVLDRLLHLAPGSVDESQRSAWSKLRQAVPDLPTRSADGQTLLAPARTFADRQNMENPELYSIFPYRLFGVDKPDLELARRTFAQRQFKGNRGWQQDDTQMAYLGLAEAARQYVADRFATKDAGSRFPAFWGPNFDWIPDQDHGGNGLMTLQTMLLQENRGKILLFPAWPMDWNVDFKLHAPDKTTVEGTYRDGKVEHLKVSPPERAKDVQQFAPQ